MTTNCRIKHHLPTIALAMVCLLCMPACKTEQTVTTKSSRYAINTGDGDDTDKIRDKFGTSYSDAFGEDEDGKKAKRSNLEGKMFDGRGGDSDFTEQEFRGTREFGESSEYRTPEYLRRQEFRTKEARETGRSAGEGQVAYREGDRTFRGGKELNFWQKLNPFRSRDTPAREADRTFDAGDYRPGNRATDTALVPEPMGTFGSGIGDYREESMSMDDVKKLLDPANYTAP